MIKEFMPEGDPPIDFEAYRQARTQEAQMLKQTVEADKSAADLVAENPDQAKIIFDRFSPVPEAIRNMRELLSAQDARQTDRTSGEVTRDMGNLVEVPISGKISKVYANATEADRKNQFYDTFQLDPNVPFEEAFMPTQYGPQLVKIPLETSDKREIFTTPLEMMEKTREQNGGAAIQENVQLAQQLLQILLSRRYTREHQDDKNAKVKVKIRDVKGDLAYKDMPVGEKLLEEFISRQHFHAVYLAYDNSDDINAVNAALKNLQSLHLNELFRLPEFVHALQFYEDNGLRFIKKDRDAFRNEAIAQMKKTLPADLLKGRNSHEKDLFWAVNLAERFWEVSGRRSMQDTARVDENNPGRKKFDDDLVGGNFAIRRLNFGNWAATQDAGFRAYPQMLEGFAEYDDFMGHPENAQGKMRLFDTKDYFQEIADNGEMKDLSPGFARSGVTRNEGKFDFINVKWEDFDFRALGDNPMYNWAFRSLFRNETTREKFATKPEQFYRNANFETLKQLNDAWDYRAADQWPIKIKLAENFLRYARNERSQQTGKLKYDIDRLKASVKELSGELDEKGIRFIPHESMNDLMEKVLGKEPLWRRLAEDNGVRFTLFFLFGFLKEAATEFWAYGMNEKKAA